MANRLTHKEKGFIDDVIAGATGTQAALNNYDTTSENVAAVIASENLSKHKIQVAIQEALPDDILGKKHRQLLDSTVIEHMTFPLGPRNEQQRADLNESYRLDAEQHGKKIKVEDGLSDEEIKDMLLEVNCRVRRIEHGEHARHVYFWAADNRAIKDALDMAYKLKGKYAPDKHVTLNITPEASPRIKELAKKLNQ